MKREKEEEEFRMKNAETKKSLAKVSGARAKFFSILHASFYI
jgi:hypothetical protein